MNDSALRARRRRLPGRGAGIPVRDGAGCPRLDACSTVPHVGHCHPRVGEARARQAAPLARSTRHLAERILVCAEALRATFAEPAGVDRRVRTIATPAAGVAAEAAIAAPADARAALP